MSDTEVRWTLEELERTARDALDAAGHAGVGSGRVRDLPDQRAIRYYATLGLLDRPHAYRGRTALYGVRHLLQLTAIKRLQAQGRSLAQVQRELLGASAAELARIAGVDLAKFAEPPPAPQSPTPPVDERETSDRQGDFWRRPPRPVEPFASESLRVSSLQGVVLDPRVSLLLQVGRALDSEDLRVIRLAAGPLLELLALRGLLGPNVTPDDPDSDHPVGADSDNPRPPAPPPRN